MITNPVQLMVPLRCQRKSFFQLLLWLLVPIVGRISETPACYEVSESPVFDFTTDRPKPVESQISKQPNSTSNNRASCWKDLKSHIISKPVLPRSTPILPLQRFPGRFLNTTSPTSEYSSPREYIHFPLSPRTSGNERLLGGPGRINQTLPCPKKTHSKWKTVYDTAVISVSILLPLGHPHLLID